MATYTLEDAKTYINTRNANDKKLFNYILSKIVGDDDFILTKNDVVSSIIGDFSNFRNDNITNFLNNSSYKQQNLTYKYTSNSLGVWENTSNLNTVNTGTYATNILTQHSLDELLKIKRK